MFYITNLMKAWWDNLITMVGILNEKVIASHLIVLFVDL